MIYIIDHKDSFTHNVVHQFENFDKVECENFDKINKTVTVEAGIKIYDFLIKTRQTLRVIYNTKTRSRFLWTLRNGDEKISLNYPLDENAVIFDQICRFSEFSGRFSEISSRFREFAGRFSEISGRFR